MSILDQAVTKGDDGYDFHCPGVTNSLCGAPGGAPFSSTGWPQRKHALARGQEHFDEHKGVGVTSSLDEFRAKHGLTVDEAGKAAVSIEDLS